MLRFWVRLSLLIHAALDLDIAFRTQKRLPFVRGAEIRMWAAPDKMHWPAAMLTGQFIVRTKVTRLLFGEHRSPQSQAGAPLVSQPPAHLSSAAAVGGLGCGKNIE